MDKNMIHIDDLFRQRMEDREASPKPGAWSNMRELLDKEMPVAASAPNWRRVVGYFTGLLLLASASVGGYSLYTGQLNSNVGTAPAALRASNTGIGNGVAASGTSAISNSGSQGAGSANKLTGAGSALRSSTAQANTATHADQPALTSATSGANSGGAHRHAGNSGSGLTGTSSRSAASVASITSATGLTSNSESAATGTASDNSAGTSAVATNIASSSKKSAFTTAPLRDRSLARKRRHSVEPESLALNAASRSATHSTQSAGNQGGKPQRRADAAPLALNSATGSQSPHSQSGRNRENEGLAPIQSGTPVNRQTPPLRILDTIRHIEIVMRRSFVPGANRPVYRLDTLPAELVVVERLIAAPEPALAAAPADKSRKQRKRDRKLQEKQAREESMALAAKPASSAAQKIPESTLNEASANANKLANETSGKLSGEKLGFWKSLRLDERVENAKTSLQSIELYPGVMGGINATVLTPNALGGFQFGLSALLAINDWWSIQGEAKYFYRFNTGSSLRDDYVSVKDTNTSYSTVSGTNYVSRSWSEARVSHNFNYEAVQTIEVPIMLRYNNNRFFTQFGVNFVSSRPIAAREVTSDPSEYKPVNSGLAPANQPNLVAFPTNTQANIRMADFGNRFGVGYAIGAGYSFTPSVYFDLRLTQTFWDNANTPGARQISKDLLRNPSFQFSLGYRFGMAKQRD
jgi:hypothetical protein